MKLTAWIWSPTGGTKKVADALTSAWSGPVETVDLFADADAGKEISLTKEDACLFAVPSFGGRVPKLAADAIRGLAGGGAKAIPVVVYGNRAIDDTLVELYDVLQQAGFCCMAAVVAVAEHSIFRQYAAGRPDAEDIGELAGYMRSIEAKLSDETAQPLADVVGNRPYKAQGKSTWFPFAAEGCTACGLCAAECPVQAIPVDAPDGVNAERCISCMHCIAVCPVQARANEEPRCSQTAEKVRDIFAGRKENLLYLG